MKMKKMSKWMLATMSAFTLALAGCGAGGAEDSDNAAAAADGGDITLRVAWWGNQDRHDLTLRVIDLFEEQNPNIQIEPEFTGWDGYWERLGTQAAGNNLPDVIQMDDSRLNEFYGNDLIIDLSPFIEDGVISLEHIEEVYIETARFEDSLLGLSLGSNARSLTYNRTLMEELGLEITPGYTYEDLKALALEAREILEAEGREFYGIDIHSDSVYEMFSTFVRQHGQSLFNEDGTGIGFEKEILVDLLTWVEDMVNAGAVPPPEIRAAYMDGAHRMIQAGSALAEFLTSNQIIGFSEGTEDELALTLTPALEGGMYGNWIRPSMLFSATSHSQEQEAAAKFIDFFVNSIEANEIMQAERGVPISSEVREHLAPMVSETVRKTFDYLDLVAEHSREADPLSPPAEREVRAAFARHSERLMFGQATPEETAERIIEETIGLLN